MKRVMNWQFPAGVAAAMLLGASLSACGEESAQNDDRTASGEVLEGSISDAMLPLDTVTSQPPLLQSQPGSGTGSEEEAQASEEDSGEAGTNAAEGEAPAEGEPSAPPTAEPAAD